MINAPMVSIIIVNYNGGSLTVDCLKSLEKQTYKLFEVVVIENGSADDSLNIINAFLRKSSLLPISKVVKLDNNIGFARGNREGMIRAKGTYLALLNNDTEVDEKWLEELVRALDDHPEIGICASKLVKYGTDTIDSAGDIFTCLLKGDKRGEHTYISNYGHTEYIFGACAGAAIYRREMIEQIGFLDEDFFLIHEDTDINYRAQLAGWKVFYVPTAIVHHKVRSSIGTMSDLAVYYTLRNSEFVRIKNVSFVVFLRCFPEFLFGIVSEFFYFAIKHKKFKLYLKAKKDALKIFPLMWKKRKIIMKTRKVNNRYLLGLMTPIWQKDFFKAKLRKFLHG